MSDSVSGGRTGDDRRPKSRTTMACCPPGASDGESSGPGLRRSESDATGCIGAATGMSPLDRGPWPWIELRGARRCPPSGLEVDDLLVGNPHRSMHMDELPGPAAVAPHGGQSPSQLCVVRKGHSYVAGVPTEVALPLDLRRGTCSIRGPSLRNEPMFGRSLAYRGIHTLMVEGPRLAQL